MTRLALLIGLALALPGAALARPPGLPLVQAPGFTPGPSPQQIQQQQLQLNEQQLQLNQLQLQQPQTPLQNQQLLNFQQQLFQQQLQLQQLKNQQGTCNALGRC